jgi:hypothetical protein
MSGTLYVLVVVQGANSLTFSPGYTRAECLEQYKGPNVACFDYDLEGSSWTAFFRLADGSLRVVRKIPSEAECQRYIGAFKSDVPAACRQLAQPDTCTPVVCRIETPLPGPPPPPPAAKPPEEKSEPPLQLPKHYPSPQPKPDPASIRQEPPTKPNSFADVSVGPTALQAKDFSTLPPKVKTASREAPPPKRRTPPTRQQYAQQQFDPLGAFVGLVTAPFARRDW